MKVSCIFLLHRWRMQRLKACVHLPAVHYAEPGAAHAPAVHLNELCTFKLFSRETEEIKQRTHRMRIQSCRHVETVSSGELSWAGGGYIECYRKESPRWRCFYWWVAGWGAVYGFLLLLSASFVNLRSLKLLPKHQKMLAGSTEQEFPKI